MVVRYLRIFRKRMDHVLRKWAARIVLAAVLFIAPSAYAQQYVATAYDLSPQSCGKSRDHHAYGITASGHSLKGKTWEDRTVSADLSVLPLGTKIHIRFPAPYGYMDGTYTVRDTGGGIHGHHIDIFFGEDAYRDAIRFGRRAVSITVL